MAEWVNEVVVVGRVAGEPNEVELPSRDAMVKWRVVVPRNKPATSVTVDTIDVVAFKAGVRKKALGLVEGDIVRIEGALRRRFWKTPSGVASRTEVEASLLTRA